MIRSTKKCTARYESQKVRSFFFFVDACCRGGSDLGAVWSVLSGLSVDVIVVVLL